MIWLTFFMTKELPERAWYKVSLLSCEPYPNLYSWVGHTASLDTVEKRKIVLSGNEPQLSSL
jgi:hypothetical protein